MTPNVITLGVTVTLLTFCASPGVIGFQVCQPTNSLFSDSKICLETEYCCGSYNDECCPNYFAPSNVGDGSGAETMAVVAMFIVAVAITCCCVCCYRCCCRRTTSRGFVYTTPGETTTVSVSLPPTHQSQQVPYPNIVPYPQQTPYPPQYNPPHNPYYGMPPPAYGVAVQSGNQQMSDPSAPFVQS